MDDTNFRLCGHVNILGLSLLDNCKHSRYSSGNFMVWGYCLVWCNILWVDRTVFLCGRGGQGSYSKFSPLHQADLHVSGTRVAETLYGNPDSIVSARQGNSSHCKECNVSYQWDVSSLRYVTQMEYWMVCKIAQSQCWRILSVGIYQEQGVWKAAKDNGGLEREH